MRRVHALAVFLAKVFAVRDTHECVMGRCVRRLHEARVVCRNQWQVEIIGEVDQTRFDGDLIRRAVARDLDIAAPRIGACQCRQFSPRIGHAALEQVPRNLALRPAGQQDQAIRLFKNQVTVELWNAIIRIQVCARRQQHQPLVAGLVLCVERYARRIAAMGPIGYIKTARHDRLDASFGHGERHFERAKQVVPVCDGHGGHALPQQPAFQALGCDHALEQRIARPNGQMDERRLRQCSFSCRENTLPSRPMPDYPSAAAFHSLFRLVVD